MFSIPAMVGLAQAIQEDGGHLHNWFQLESGAITDFLDQFANNSNNNKTGVTITSTEVEDADSINAAGAMWYLKYWMNQCSSYSGNDLLRAGLNAYNRGYDANEYGYLLDGGYGYSVLWKAYGSNYASHSSTSWDGAYMATGPSRLQCAAGNPPLGSSGVDEDLPTPGFTVPRTQYEAPYGYNSSGHRTVLFTYATADYVSGLAIETWLYNSPYSEAYLTQGYDIAALTAKRGLDFCVIVVGGPAYTQIIDTANSLGFHLTAYSDFAAWRSGAGTNPGFVNADGSSANDSYNLGLTAAKAAADAGWA
ncbi:MAG: hypothetical protein ACP5QO_13595 [Clostridia bacterium]